MKKNFLFLGFWIPQDEVSKIFLEDKFPAIQTHKFILNFIKGIENEDSIECTYIFAKAVSDYPYFNKKKIEKQKIKEKILNKTLDIELIPFRNTSILKIVTRFFWSFYFSLKNYLKVKNKGGVIVYSVHVPFLLVGYLISKIFKMQLIGIWTDPPSILNERESYIKSKLRKIELKLSKILMKKFDKTIVLTKYLAEEFNPGKPYLVLEGIIDKLEVCKEKIEKNNHEIKIVYTGSLVKRYGIENIVKAFQLIKKENIVLEIYGRGEYEEELKNISKVNSKIKYFGFIDNKKILNIQRKANFLINARDTRESYTKYSFPSKMMEYMMSGTPIITTILDGFPNEYKDYLICLKNNSSEEIAKKILEVSKWTIQEQIQFGDRAKKFILSKSYIEQGKKIVQFIEK